MFRCYNPSCCLRQKGKGFSRVGLHSHFRSNPSCESHFIAWQQRQKRSSGEPVLVLGPGEDPESHSQFNHDRTNACSDPPNVSNNGNGEDVHTENLDDKSTDSENTRYTRSEAVYGSEEEDMEPDGQLPVPDMEEEEMEDSSQWPEAEIKDASPGILESSAKNPVRPNNIYDFRVQNTISAFEWVQQWVSWSKSLGEDSTEHHPSGKPDDLSLLELLLEDPNYFAQWHCVSEVEKSEIKLMSRLNKINGCPLYVYDVVRNWTKETFYTGGDDSDTNHIIGAMRSREQVLRSSVKMAHTSCMQPSTYLIDLPGCGKKVDITVVPYLGNLYNFLTNEELVNDNTLLLNGSTPYDGPVLEKDYTINDFNTGARYVNAWEYKKKDPIDFPLGEIFFVDKSVYDCNDRLSSEPVMHTNSLVCCTARNKSEAWSSLGYLPRNSDLGHDDYEGKLSDYHLCLSHILDEYKKVQTTKAGLLWPLSFKGQIFMVRFRPYVLSVLGDTPGQNQMTGKMTKCNRLCRVCDIEKSQLSDPWAKAEKMTIERQRRIQMSDSLCQEYCYKKIDVFWNQLCFGNDLGGIHSNVPGEILHAFMKGVLLRVHECIVATPSLSQSARKADKKQLLANVNNNSVQPSVPHAPTQEDLIKRGVFGGKMGQQIDAIARILGKQLAHQSDRNICRLYFKQGIISRTKTTASEQQGLTLLMAMILASTWSLQEDGLRDRLGDMRTGSYIKIMENLLCLEEIFKIHPGKAERSLMASDIPAISYYTRMLLQSITEDIPRETGDGFNLIKIHLLTHMIEFDIINYGLPRNISGCAGESQFKDNFKLPASTTQKRESSFDEQVSQRRHEHVTIDRCMRRLARIEQRTSDIENQTVLPVHFGSCMRETTKGNTEPLSRPTLSDSAYCVAVVHTSSEPSATQVDIVYTGGSQTTRAMLFPGFDDPKDFLLGEDDEPIGLRGRSGLHAFNDSFSVIRNFLAPLLEFDKFLQIKLYSKLKVPKGRYQEADVIYRADPCCQIGNKERHDWALVQWNEDDGKIPCQIYTFLDVDEKLMKAFNSTICSGKQALPPLENTGTYAVVCSLRKEIPGLVDPSITEHAPEDIMQMNSIIFFYGTKETDDAKQLVIRLVLVETFVRPLIVVPDFDPTFCKTSGMTVEHWVQSEERRNSVIVVRPRDQWHLAFLALAKKEYDKPNKKTRNRKKRNDKRS